MLFHSVEFAVFFALFCVALSLRPLRRWTVLLASNVFYGWWDWRLLGLIWFTVVLDYWISVRIAATDDPPNRKLLLALSVTSNLSVLAFFKYLPAATWGIFELLGRPKPPWVSLWILPLGISFYTFQSIAYTVDVYRRRYPPLPTLVDFANFVFFFPQLVAGPIERPDHLSPQLKTIRPPIASRFPRGAFMFTYGMLRKTGADGIAAIIDPLLANVAILDRTSLALCIVGFGFQIYLDFSAYTWMARGMAWLLNIELMENFREPYLATSPSDFWRRWHISLSTWLRDYLYIPLGGSRGSAPRVYLNLMLVMLLGGLWHGAALGFVIWGFIHGLLLIAFRPVQRERTAPSWVRSAVGWVVTLTTVNYAWLFFRLPHPDQFIAAHETLLRGTRSSVVPDGAVVIALWIAFSFGADAIRRLADRRGDGSAPFFAYGIATPVCLVLSLALQSPETRPYVYFVF